MPEATQHEGQPEPKLPGPACAGSLLRVQGPRRKDARRGLQNGDRPCVAGQLDLGSRKPRAPAGKRPASAWSAECWRRAARRLPSLSRPPAGLPRAPMGSPGFPKPGRLLWVPALCSHPTACPGGMSSRSGTEWGSARGHQCGSPGPRTMTLGKSLSPSEPQLPHHEMGVNSSGPRRLNWTWTVAGDSMPPALPDPRQSWGPRGSGSPSQKEGEGRRA